MKKLNRKLIPAFAMLLLSAVLMSTASFAWFSSNGQVSVEGMKVSATAPAALWISKQATNGFTTSIDMSATSKALTPATATIGENNGSNASEWTFYTLNDTKGYQAVDVDGKLKGQGTDGAAGWLTDANVEELGMEAVNGTNAKDPQYFFMQKFYLRLEGQNDGGANIKTKNISAVVTLEGKANDIIYQALRVAIATDAKDEGLQTPAVVASTPGYQVFGFGEISDIDSTTKIGTATGEKVSGGNNIMTIAAQETVAVYVYIWFEGNDEQCNNNNSNFVDEYAISISFTAADPAPSN